MRKENRRVAPIRPCQRGRILETLGNTFVRWPRATGDKKMGRILQLTMRVKHVLHVMLTALGLNASSSNFHMGLPSRGQQTFDWIDRAWEGADTVNLVS